MGFRHDPIGGGIDLGRAWFDFDKLKGLSRFVFLLHGYNNTQEDAEAAYAAFCRGQQELVTPGRDWTRDAALVRLYWPGDAKWGIFAPAYYPGAVSRAQDVALILAQMLDELSRHSTTPLELHFVAHSLGNRVLLRALAALHGNSRATVRRTVHMAAAVPTWKLRADASDPDQLALGLEMETGVDSHAKSLYSRSDGVLAWAFPFGETVSPEHDGILPTAFGHEYWGEGVLHANLSQWPASGAGHGDYWGGDRKTSPRLRAWVAATVRDELDLGSAGERRMVGALPLDRMMGEDRSGETRALRAREVLESPG